MAAAKISGIYEIVNTVNGKRYVGSAVDIRRRWQDHASYLKRGAHHSAPLQRAWAKYGAEAFEFRIIERSDEEFLLAREQALIDAIGPDYNVCRIAGSSKGIKHSLCARANMAAAQRRRGSTHLVEMNKSAEARARSSSIHRGNSYCKGKSRPQHVRDRCGQRGACHHQADPAIYALENAFGIRVVGTQIEIREQTGISGPELSRVIKGKRRSAKGWNLIPS